MEVLNAPREDRELPIGRLGYAIEQEDRPYLEATGVDPLFMLKMAEKATPEFNPVVHPMTLLDPLNQGSQGSCQGHALAMIFTICYFLQTGRILHFSRAAAYYLSQRKDGIRGDRGSTLSGGQWVATQHGLCLEKDWAYPAGYNPSEPSGIIYPYKLVASRPTRDPGVAKAWMDIGLPVQDGIVWDNSVSRTRVTNYIGRGGGGHSTVLWTKAANGDYRRINSWGEWDGDGCNENSPESIDQQVRHSFSTHICYGPAEMIYPELKPVEV